MSQAPVRVAAAQLLKELFNDGRSLATLLPQYSERVIENDRPFLQALVKGVCRWQPRYHAWLQANLKKPLKKKDADIEALVYLGIFQLLEMRIPDHAAIAETVEAAKKLKKVWAVSLLNALLRKVQRSGQLEQELPEKSDVSEYAHPAWLIRHIKRAWPDQFRGILEANNTQAPMTLRVNRMLHNRAAYAAKLDEENVPYRLSAVSADGLVLKQACDAIALPGFLDGAASVQDEAAQLAAGLLDLQPGQRVLDACCAPGGKTSHILEAQPNLKKLIAVDLDGERLKRVADNLARLRLQAELKAADIMDLDSWWDGQAFQRILLDAPCSATGVIRRHPDIKLLRRSSDIDSLAELQLALLKRLWGTLAPGGRLVYATCSVLPEENEQVIQQFMNTQTDAVQIDVDLDCGSKRPYGMQLFPQIDGHDGFYYAVLCKPDQPTS